MKLQVCQGNTCGERFSSYILERLQNDKKFYKKKSFIIEPCMCLGKCKKGPNIVLDGEIYNGMNPTKASQLIFKPKKEK